MDLFCIPGSWLPAGCWLARRSLSTYQPHALQAHSLGGDGVFAQIAETNRRRLIIEQMILLALRCLLVLLAGFLVARFVGARPTGQGATHIVILDDTPSMADQFTEKGPKTNSFEVAREQIKLLAHSAAQAPDASTDAYLSPIRS